MADEKTKEKDEPRLRVTDRRFWVQEEEPTESEKPASPYPSFVEELQARTEAAEAKLKEKMRQLEEENEAFRLRLKKELERRTEQDRLRMLRNFLEVVDNFERTLEAARITSDVEGLRKGVELNLQLFLDILESHGIERLELLNQPFDPHEAEAIGTVAVDDPSLDQRVAEVVRHGFRWDDQLLRPAQVRVGQFTSGPDATEGAPDNLRPPDE